MSQILNLQLSGVSCNGCVGKIRQALQRRDPGAEVSVTLPGARARIDTELSRQDVASLISELGYGVEAAPRRTLRLQVEGISCNSCVNKVRRALEPLDPGAKIAADLESKELTFRSWLSESELITLLDELGYQGRPVDPRRFTLAVEGITCNGCVSKVRRGLQNLDADGEVEADLERKELTFRSWLSEGELIALLDELGYRGRPVERGAWTLKVEGITCNGCVNKVRRALEPMDPQGEVDADLERKELTFRSCLNEEALIALLAELGYQGQSAAETVPPRETEPAATAMQGQGQPEAAQAGEARATDETAGIQLSLQGMTCAGCVRSVEQALASVAGVERVDVNFASRTALVTGAVDVERLVSAVVDAGYGASPVEDAEQAEQEKEALEAQEYRRRLRNTAIGLGLGVPLMLYGLAEGMAMEGGGVHPGWVLVGLATLGVLLTAGRHFFVGAWKALRRHNANMDTLIAVGTGSAWAYSMVVVLLPELLPASARGLYFEAAAMIIGLINLGQALEIRARGRTNQAIRRLLDLQVKTARVLRGGEEVDLPVEQVRVDDLLRVRPGEKLAVDGEVVEGRSLVDESMLTGEPVAVDKQPGDALSAGTLNRAGTLVYRATRVGRDTALAQIVDLVRRAQNTKPPISHLADQVASIFVPAVLIIAVITALVWFNFGPEPRAVYMLVTAVTVLIIACPCALGLATPISTMIGIGKAAEHGILVRNGEALQRASSLTTVVLDKTGTITQGRPEVTDFETVPEVDRERVLDLLYALEAGSEHPLAEAVSSFTGRRGRALPVTGFEALSGRGVQAQLEGQRYLLGNERLMAEQGVDLAKWRDRAEAWEAQARTVIYLAIPGRLLAILGISDPIKADAAEAIQRLHEAGLKVMMLTGDNAATAKAVAAATGVDSFQAQLLPEDKLRIVKELQAAGEQVGMTGDGINDAPALSQAEVGFAIGTGTDVAIESADVTLMRGSLHGLADAIELSRATLTNIKQNLWGAFIYNGLGIPVAAGLLFPFTGMLLNPVIAGVAMSLSSVTVVTNANRLRLFRTSDQSQPEPVSEAA